MARHTIHRLGLRVGAVLTISTSDKRRAVLQVDCDLHSQGPTLQVGTVAIPSPLFRSLLLTEAAPVLLEEVGGALRDLPAVSRVELAPTMAPGRSIQEQRVFYSAICQATPCENLEPPADPAGGVLCCTNAVGRLLCDGVPIVDHGAVAVTCWGVPVVFQAVAGTPGVGRIDPKTEVLIRLPLHLTPRLPPSPTPSSASHPLPRPPKRSPLPGAKSVVGTAAEYIGAAWQRWAPHLWAGLAPNPARAVALEVGSLACALFAHAQYNTATTWRRTGLDYLAADRSLPFPCPTGVLLHGVSGVGKTELARCLCDLLATMPATAAPDPGHVPPVASYFYDVPADLFGTGKTSAATVGRAVQAVFREATAHPPAVLVLDNVEVLSGSSFADTGSRVGLLELAHQLDLLALRRLPVLVVALAGNLAHVDRTLLTVSRLAKVLEVSLPTAAGRALLLDRWVPRRWAAEGPARTRLLAAVADRTNGCLPADLRHVVCLSAVRRSQLSEQQTEGVQMALQGIQLEIECHGGGDTEVSTEECFDWALQQLSKSGGAAALGAEAAAGQPTAGAGPLIGLAGHLERLLRHVLLPLERPRELAALGIRVPRGVLLYGPSGTGKTHLARHISSHRLAVNLNVLSANAADLVHKVVGESEKAVARLFAVARTAAPCLLFVDQFEAIAVKRNTDLHQSAALDRLLSTLLIELDGIGGGGAGPVVLVAATNRREALDPAVLRSGRLDIHLEFHLPDAAQREALLRGFLAQTRCTADLPLADLVAATARFSPADLVGVVQRAALRVLRRCVAAAGEGPVDPAAVELTAADLMAALPSHQ